MNELWVQMCSSKANVISIGELQYKPTQYKWLLLRSNFLLLLLTSINLLDGVFGNNYCGSNHFASECARGTSETSWHWLNQIRLPRVHREPQIGCFWQGLARLLVRVGYSNNVRAVLRRPLTHFRPCSSVRPHICWVLWYEYMNAIIIGLVHAFV